MPLKVKEAEFESRVIFIKRVVKVTEGGRVFRFASLVVVGNKKGIVGFGYSKAKEPARAVLKAELKARKNLIKVPIIRGTLPYPVEAKWCASRVLLKPAAPGTALVASYVVSPVLELAGYTDVISKTLGSTNPRNVIKAVFLALKQLKMPGEIAEERGITLQKLFN